MSDLAPCPDDRVFVQLLEGGLGSSEKSKLDRHLDGCARCNETFAALGELVDSHHADEDLSGLVSGTKATARGVMGEAQRSSMSDVT